MHDKRVVPYDTGKVKIGERYVPPPPPMDEDDEQIQASLLYSRPWYATTLRNVLLYVFTFALALALVLIISFMEGNGHA